MKELLINGQIRVKEVRLIAKDGSQLGVMSAAAAQRIADDSELDLVMISPTANPPVCKVLDYNKYKYEQTKREKELKKNQKIVELKTIQLSMTIDENDMKTKAKAATKWLADGDKVKISLRMVGRQMAYSQNAVDVVNKFCAMLPAAKVEKMPQQEGRYINMIIAPQSAK